MSTFGLVPHKNSLLQLNPVAGYGFLPHLSLIAAHSSYPSGNWDIWVAQAGSGQAVNRTADSAADDQLPSWSPDGQWIAFFSGREGGGYFVMAAVGGIPRSLVPWPPRETSPIPAQWSHDGKQLAYVLGQRSEPRLEILTVLYIRGGHFRPDGFSIDDARGNGDGFC